MIQREYVVSIRRMTFASDKCMLKSHVVKNYKRVVFY